MKINELLEHNHHLKEKTIQLALTNRQIQIIKNPNWRQIQNLLQKLLDRKKSPHIRGYVDDANYYVWAAYDSIHGETVKSLGIDYDYKNRCDITVHNEEYDHPYGVRFDCDFWEELKHSKPITNLIKTLPNIQLNLNEKVILESRSAPLYHGTSLVTAGEILKINELHGNTFHKLKDKEIVGISLSRSLNFVKYWIGNYPMANGVIFVLDQEKITHRYKLLPIDYFSTEKGKGDLDVENIFSKKKYLRRVGPTAEAEEFLLTSKLDNFDSYLKGILITELWLSNAQKMLDNMFTPKDSKANIQMVLNHPKLRVIK